MPLWSWRRSCCGGAAGDDDCSTGECSEDQRVSHSTAVKQSAPDNAITNMVLSADDGSVIKVTPVNHTSPAQQSKDMDKAKSDKLLMSPHNYHMLTVIGNGSYGGVKIWLSKYVPLNQHVAVKRIDLDHCKLSFSLLQHEINMHRLLRHKNILPILSCFSSYNEIWMVLPLKAYGSCRDLVRAHFKFGLPEMAIAYILKEVLQALEYLHIRCIIHRDIRASHIFIQSDGSICLSGLRHCFNMFTRGHRLKRVHEFPDFYVNSLNWASRELLEQGTIISSPVKYLNNDIPVHASLRSLYLMLCPNLAGYDTKSDVYSLGITACELANGMVPFQDMPLIQMLLSKIEGTTPRLLDITTIPELATIGNNKSSEADVAASMHESLLPYHRVFSEQFHNLIELCLVNDPQTRPSAMALSSHNFFKQIHRKSNPPPLTDLLKPLNPITASAIPVFGDSAVESLADGIAELAVDFEWTF